MAPTRAGADQLYDERVARIARGDANDSLWAIESIEEYSPEPDLPKILKPTDLFPSFRAGLAADESMWIYYNQPEKKVFIKETVGSRVLTKANIAKWKPEY